MERQGWIASEWRVTEQNQRAKFYQLTREGRKQLVRDRSKWEAIVEAMAGVLESRV
jgi:PadR family transcriptional regulator, regulatory protein PadR